MAKRAVIFKPSSVRRVRVEMHRADDVMPAAKGLDQDDNKLFARIIFSVKICRERMNARGAWT